MITKIQPALAESGTSARTPAKAHRLTSRLRLIIPGLAIIALLLAVAGAGCTESPTEPDDPGAFTLTDDSGKVHHFAGPVDSIISLAPSATEIVFAVGAGDKLIGRTDFCNYPPEVADIQSIGGYSTPNWENVVVTNPDVVLASTITSDEQITWLRDLGVRVFILEPVTLDDVMDNILVVGKMAGTEDNAETLVDGLRDRIASVEDITSTIPANERPGVLHITWHDPLWTAGQGTYIDAIITMAGGTNIFAGIQGHAQVNVDTAVVADPKVITIFGGHDLESNDAYDWTVAAGSPFNTTQAYVDNRLHLVDADLSSRGGPRLVDALEEFARIMHPGLFD